MKRLTYKRWTDADRQQLHDLAAQHVSDITIATVMGRTPSAVSWQRRYLRIRLSGNQQEKYAAAERLRRKPSISVEDANRVDRLMALAFGERLIA